MNVLSLFAGIGGLELGLERAGMTVVGQVEIDPFCRSVLERHWPDVPRHDDVRTAVEWWLGETRPPVDVVCGGFPCQPWSQAGRRTRTDDERWLWPLFADVVRAIRPRFVVVENVPGLLSGGLGLVLGDLADLRYDAEWQGLPAAAVGAPHLRWRVFVVAYTDSAGLEGRGSRLVDENEGRQIASPVGHDPSRRATQMADADSERPQGGRLPVAPRAPVPDAGRGDPRIFRATLRHERQWAPEPDVGRVAHGIPRRVDRLRALGNAVVPQVAEHIGRLVMAVEETKVRKA